MRRTALMGLAVVTALATGLTACSSSGSPSSGSSGKGGSITLTIESNPLPSFTDNFNPFLQTSLARAENVTTLIYEPLLEFNVLQPGTIHNWLATGYSWSAGGKTLTLSLRTGVKWSDGQAFSSADVAYTFQLIKDNKALNSQGLTISSVSAPDANTVVLTFPTAQYANLYYIAGSTYIVPKHLWSGVSNPSTYTDPSPVGTGPYTLTNFAATGLTFKKNATYWYGANNLAASQINVPAYSGNTAAELALSNGNIDWAGNQIPNVQQIFVNKNPNANHTFFAPANTVTLQINVANGGPLADPVVRQAISVGIDRNALATEGEYGQENAATSSSGLVLPADNSLVPSQYSNDLKQDKAKVTSLLSGDGYTMQGGMWTKGGKQITFNIEDPTSYTDYYADAQLITQQLKSEGFDVSTDGVTPDKWYSDSANGTFSTIIHWGTVAPTPYAQYQAWLDSTTTAAVGQPASNDYTRYSNPAAQAALTEYAGSNDAATQQDAINKLAQIVSTQLPVIPLLYGAQWDEYSTAKVTNWPTAQNPYMAPSPNDPQIGYILTQIKPAS
jgi:peptide/nickel transport system substrate-binding protein